MNRHAPAGEFQESLEAIHRLSQDGRIRGLRDIRSGMHMAMLHKRCRVNALVKPPEWAMTVLAWLGRRLGYSVD